MEILEEEDAFQTIKDEKVKHLHTESIHQTKDIFEN